MDKRLNRDLISDLPLSIIHCILELVPIKDAVKTSLLSRQWRCKWATLPHLVFDDDSLAKDHDRISHFINQVLLLHKGPIHKFELRVFYEEKCYLDQWLSFLSTKDIKMFIFSIDNVDWGYIHSSLYSFQNLTTLELYGCDLHPPPPTFTGFLNLRRLFLELVGGDSDTIQSVFANSPLLEELKLRESSSDLELRICAPNLKHFHLKGDCNSLSLFAPLLSKLSINFEDQGFIVELLLEKKSSACNFTNFIGNFPNLEELYGGPDLIKYLKVGIESCDKSLVFHHLRKIEPSGVDVHDMLVVVRLIKSSPHIQKLSLSSCSTLRNTSEAASVSSWNSECAPNFTFKRLTLIEMNEVHGLCHEMKLIKFLLSSLPLLKKMFFRPSTSLTDDKKFLNLAAKLLSYRRSSAKARILISKR